MRKGDRFRFSLGWNGDTEEKIAVGDLLDRLGNRKSDLVVQALWEYSLRHPEIFSPDAKIVIRVQATPTSEQILARVQGMIEASMNSLRADMVYAAVPTQTSVGPVGPSERDLDDMLSNLDIFEQ